jgi:hypothetical protein
MMKEEGMNIRSGLSVSKSSESEDRDDRELHFSDFGWVVSGGCWLIKYETWVWKGMEDQVGQPPPAFYTFEWRE